MGLKSEVQRLYTSKFSTLNARQVIYPVTGAGAGTGLGAVCTSGAALTYGAWQNVAALVAVENFAVGVIIDTASVIETYTVQIGSTFSLGVAYADAAAVIAAGAAAIAGAARAEAVRQIYVAVLAVLGPGFFPLAVPVWYGPGHGILARTSTISGADTLNVSVVCVQNT